MFTAHRAVKTRVKRQPNDQTADTMHARARGSLLATIVFATFVACAIGAQSDVQELELEDATTVVLQAELRSVQAAYTRLMKQLEECEANCRRPTEARAPTRDPFFSPKAQHHRKALATPAPTPLMSSEGATPPFTPVPTTEDITTHAQLAAAVAKQVSDEIVIAADVAFPSQSPITVNTSQSASIVGRSSAGAGGGRVTLDGLGDSRLFLVEQSATLHLINLNLVNGIVPIADYAQCSADRRDDPSPCKGGAILVLGDATLVMSNCDIRGQEGPLGPAGFPMAKDGGGIFTTMHRSLLLYNITFVHLCANEGAAVTCDRPVRTGVDSLTTFDSCRFEGNYAIAQGKEASVVFSANFDDLIYFYDCHWENNIRGSALYIERTEPGRTMGWLKKCTFRNNTQGMVYIAVSTGVGIEDCIFERNIGTLDMGGEGSTVGVFDGGFCTMQNCTFIENVAYDGGAVAAVLGSMTFIDCYFFGNTAVNFGEHSITAGQKYGYV